MLYNSFWPALINWQSDNTVVQSRTEQSNSHCDYYFYLQINIFLLESPAMYSVSPLARDRERESGCGGARAARRLFSSPLVSAASGAFELRRSTWTHIRLEQLASLTPFFPLRTLDWSLVGVLLVLYWTKETQWIASQLSVQLFLSQGKENVQKFSITFLEDRYNWCLICKIAGKFWRGKVKISKNSYMFGWDLMQV